MSVGSFLGIIALMFVLELPDKTMIATIVMGTRARPLAVAIGSAVGFVVHMAIAVVAGTFLAKLPHTPKEIVVGLLFLGGAYYLLFHSEEEEMEKGEKEGKEEQDAYERVKLDIATEQQRRLYRIDDTRRALRVTKARLGYEGTLLADRDGRILDLQVVRGQTVKAGQRLGTLGGQQGDPLLAVAYFPPADARRLQVGLPVEVVPDWNERGRFGGIFGRVQRVSVLPATREDVDTTMGSPQLADALVRSGPVMRADITLERSGRGVDGYRWTLSRGSSVFPIHEGLTLKAHGYVEWRTPISYLLPVVRELTGSYRNLSQESQDRPQTRQEGTLP